MLLFEGIYSRLMLLSIAIEDAKSFKISNIQLFFLFSVCFLMDMSSGNLFLFEKLMIASLFLVIFFLIWKISHGLGLGDVKLVFPIGYIFGFLNTAIILSIASISGLIYIFINNRKIKKIPFAPFIFIGVLFNDLLSLLYNQIQ